MTKTIELTGDLDQDYRILQSELQLVNQKIFWRELSRAEPAIRRRGGVSITWEIDSEYDDGSSYYDIINDVTVRDVNGEIVDLYEEPTLEDASELGFNSEYLNNMHIHDGLVEHFNESVDYLSDLECDTYNFDTKEFS